MRKLVAGLRTAFLPLLAVLALSLTGCQMMHDLFPFFGGGEGEGEQPIGVPVSDMPEEQWTGPGESVSAPGEWDVVTSVKFPVVYFSYDKCALGTREQRILDQVADYMSGKDGYGLIVSGHCDERGSKEYNMALGEKRALAVKDYLVAKGVSPERVRTVSYGEEKPAMDGHDESTFSKNRRAELELARMK
jgi:peptidoglycan-associated lipoprotein